MARPRIENPKAVRLGLALTEAEREQIRANAKLAGLTVSEYLRQAALGAEIHARPQGITLDALYELRRIGNNLNQLTRASNDPTRLLIKERALAVLEDHQAWILLHTPDDRRGRIPHPK